MREKAVSLAEKKFILQALARKQRLDHRGLLDQRQILIQLSNRITGTCLVSLGETKVLCQTNYKVEEPRETRPSEGKLRINLESSTSPVYENEKVDASGQEYSAIQSLLEQAFVKSSALGRDQKSSCDSFLSRTHPPIRTPKIHPKIWQKPVAKDLFQSFSSLN